MKREFLKQMGIADDLIDKIMDENGKDINAAKGDLETVSKERDGYKTSIGEYEKQLADLKKSAGDNAALTQQITDLQAKNKTQADDFAKTILQLKLDNAVDLALSTAKAKDPKTVKGVLDMTKIKLNDKGEVEGLSEQIKDLQKSHDYLFDTAQSQGPMGVTPAGGGDGLPNGGKVTQEQFNRMGYKDRLALYKSDPETFKSLNEKG